MASKFTDELRACLENNDACRYHLVIEEQAEKHYEKRIESECSPSLLERLKHRRFRSGKLRVEKSS